jgi:LmbE family N-acetylglucosaminyl deacetylase
MVMRKYLFCGAHPDDIEISAGGFLLNRLRRGNHCHMLVLGCDTQERIDEQFHVFSQLEAQFNGYEKTLFTYDLFSYSDGNLEDAKLEYIDIVEGLIERRQFDVVLTHFPKDTHRDHRAVSSAVTDAARKISLLYFESPNVYEFEPNFYCTLSEEELEEKIELMSLHKSQNEYNDNYYLNKIRATATFRGQPVYSPAAEAFHTFRYQVNGE